uniref:Uncharacterized protein n=1 Tax=Hyaloperonospora arabidopsidis (strain Emoy2) TaxID=559515 RepID=M4BE95_HYAAE
MIVCCPSCILRTQFVTYGAYRFFLYPFSRIEWGVIVYVFPFVRLTTNKTCFRARASAASTLNVLSSYIYSFLEDLKRRIRLCYTVIPRITHRLGGDKFYELAEL